MTRILTDAQIQQLEEALTFYANPTVYEADSIGRRSRITFVAESALTTLRASAIAQEPRVTKEQVAHLAASVEDIAAVSQRIKQISAKYGINEITDNEIRAAWNRTQDPVKMVRELGVRVGGEVVVPVDWMGLALDLEAQAKRVQSQTAERAMLAAAHGLRSMGGGAQVDELAMLIRQLVHSLRKAAPAHALADKALDYLSRKGLAGSPLRAPSVCNEGASDD